MTQPPPWTAEPDQLLESLAVDPAEGLSPAEVARRQQQYGPNSIEVSKSRGWLEILVAQFRGLLVGLLAAAAALSALFGQWPEAIAVGIVLILNAAIGFVTELRAVRSVEALRRLGAAHATVRRAGSAQRVVADDLVPGDVLLLEGGDLVAADARLLKESQLEVDESSLTGESVQVSKDVAALPADTLLPDRAAMVFKGTPVSRGAAEAVVVATGMETELGKISRLVSGAGGDDATPLEKRLSELAHRLVWLTLIVAALITLTGLGSGKSWLVLLQTAIALAVATVPEGLPIIATLTLARGVARMAGRNALVNRLSAVETLGATSVILTDKTGTLTENRMRATTFWLPGGVMELSDQRSHVDLEEQLRRALTIGALCVTAELPRAGDAAASVKAEEAAVGDPMELALLQAAREHGIERAELLEEHAELRQMAFDPDTRLMATAHSWVGGSELVAVKGAPGAVMDAVTRVANGAADSAGGVGTTPLTAEGKEAWLQRNRELAARGLRVLALAEKRVNDAGTGDAGQAGAGSVDASGQDAGPYEDLTLVGLVGFADPPRAGIEDVLAQCADAGIRVIMATGDQAITARSIAEQVGIRDAHKVLDGKAVTSLLATGDEGTGTLLAANVLARVAPEQKLELVRLHQEDGQVVAMTGDGVNDAPALRRADIGVAMGKRGTEVAREAADMVLLDDAFGTIISAVKEGRVIFDNIRAFVLFLLSCNLSEILVIGLAGVIGYPLPLLPLQILFLNLITDVFPALALGAGRGDKRILERAPRPSSEPLLARRHWAGIIGYGSLLTITTLGAFVYALQLYDTAGAVTVAFLGLALGQVWHVFNMRDPGSSLLNNQVTRNRWVWAATLGCTALLALVVVVEPLRQVLSIQLLDARGWWLIVAAGLAPMVLGQAGKALGLGRVS
jgi:Ca2+-transporting ATPase